MQSKEIKKMKFIADRRCFLLASSALAIWGVIGCATGSGRSLSPYARELPLTFEDATLREQMTALGLLPVFIQYWTAYTHRRWADRYQLERFTGELAESFYIVYHDAAWLIKGFNVIKLHEPDEKGRVRVDVDATYRSLTDTNTENRQLVQDWWVHQDGRWLHVSVDPMLNGMKSVL